MIHVQCVCVCVCCHIQCVHRCLTLWCLCRHRPRGGFSSHPSPAQCPQQQENKARSSSCIRWDLCRNTVNIKGIYAPPPPSIWRLFPWRSGRCGDVSDLGLGELLFQARRFIKVSDKCRNRTLEFSFQPRAAQPRLQHQNLQHFYFVRKCYTTTVLGRKTSETSPRVSRITDFALKCSYWKCEDGTLWHKIAETRKKRGFLPFRFKRRLKCLRTS